MKGTTLHGLLNNSAISIHLSEKALTFLEHAKKPIYVGMELYFTYFMQKKVVFLEEKPKNKVAKITDYLYMYFIPMQAKSCKLEDLKGDSFDAIEMPVTRMSALTPKQIKIDLKKGKWLGDFTWKSLAMNI
ncbi:MAG: hypothetical protein OEX22_03515 [Cyclobacteriaceae bacterium]|nr:hypothetical protein [Cyclobacteriaceae bacterium]